MTLDLRSSEIEHQFIQERIDSVEHLMSKLCSLFGSYNRKVAHLRDSGDKLAKTMLELTSKEVLNPSLRLALVNFSDIVWAIQDYREAKVQRLDHRVILEFSAYDHICKQTKEQLKKGFSTRAKVVMKLGQLEKIRGKKPTNWQQINQAEREADKARTDAVQATIHVSQEIDSFERKKLQDLKRVLLDFINIELLFHTKALELYTKAYQAIDEIKPDDDLQEFRNRFRFPYPVGNVEINCPPVKISDCVTKTLKHTPTKAQPSIPAQRKENILEGNLETISALAPKHSSSSSDLSDCSSESGSTSEGKKTFKMMDKLFRTRSKKSI